MHFSAASSPTSGFTSGDPSDTDFWLGRGTGHGRSSTVSTSGSSASTSPANPVCGPVIDTSPPSPSSPPTLLVAATAALIATNLACVRRMRRWVLMFEFINASNERGRGGAGFGGRFLRFFDLAGLVGRSCCWGGGAGPEVARDGRGGRVFAMKSSDDCAPHQSSIVSEGWGAWMRARLRIRGSYTPFLSRNY